MKPLDEPEETRRELDTVIRRIWETGAARVSLDRVARLLRTAPAHLLAPCLAEKLAQVLQGVRETGKEGKLTLELSIKPAKIHLNEVKQVQLKTTCKAKVPEPDTGVSIFYTNEDNIMIRDDPNQLEMELAEAEEAPE